MLAPVPLPTKTPQTRVAEVSIASCEDSVKLADRYMCQCVWPGYLVPIARLKTAEMGPSFLGLGALSNNRSIHEQDLNSIRIEKEAHEATVMHQGQSHPESLVH